MIDIKFGHMFMWHIRLVAAVVAVVALAIFPTSIPGGLILLLASCFVITASEGTDFDLQKKTIREYNSFFFLKTGNFEPLGKVDYIFINSGTESQQMSSPRGIQTAVFENAVFNAYLKLSSGEKIKLLKEKNKLTLIKKLQALSEGLPAEIVDHS